MRRRMCAAAAALLALAALAGGATAVENAAGQTRAVLLVSHRGGLPASWIARLRRDVAVDALAEVSRTQWLLRATRVGRVRAGWAIPLDVLVVDARAYARATGETGFTPLRRGSVLLSASSARLRRLGVGDSLTLTGGRRVTIAGLVGDDTARGAEVVAATADVPRAQRRATVAVLATHDPAAVRRAVPRDRLTRVGPLDAQPDSATTAGAITHPVQLKERFGEFAVRLPYGRDWITIDPRWVRRNIVTRAVPILGRVTCHRATIAPLRRALGLLVREGLARLVDRGDYGGCWAARRIPVSGSLSLHAWGLAVDVNASRNPQGSKPTQDPRVVRAFESVGFTWGGRWPTNPDGMHFEWHGR